MSIQNTSFHMGYKSIPQVYFDFIARLIPGIIILASISAAFFGSENFWNILQSWASKLNVFSYAIFSILILLFSYVFAVLVWCAWSWFIKLISKKVNNSKVNNWDDEEFRFHYETIKYKNPTAGDRITKLKAQVHMTEVLIVGFAASFLLNLRNVPNDLFLLGLLLVLIIFSWNARGYFIRHMKASLNNNLKILMSQRAKHMQRLIILFDFDGTLVDIDKLEAYKRLLKPKRDPNLAKLLYEADNKLCAEGNYDRRNVFEQFQKEVGDDTKRLCKIFWENVTNTQKIKSCCLSTLSILKNEGHVLACVTDSDGFGGNKLKRIEATRLNRYFDKIFIGGENGRPPKGSPEYMEWIIKELGLYLHRWVMIGDKTNIDLKPAEAEGITTILVKNDEYPGKWPLEIHNLNKLVTVISGLKSDSYEALCYSKGSDLN